jgi:hypothetical protein
VIIHDLNVVGVAAPPPKARTPPIVDPDAVLPGTVARQLLEPVAGRDSQVIQRFGRVENDKLSQGRRHPAHLDPRQRYNSSSGVSSLG